MSVHQAVGCEDQTVRIISLDPESTLETISLQALTAPPSSICIADMLDASINKTQPTMFVNIGLQNGVLLRTVLDPNNGQLTDTRTRYAILFIYITVSLVRYALGSWALDLYVLYEYRYKEILQYWPFHRALG
jgi:hypothetical protein